MLRFFKSALVTAGCAVALSACSSTGGLPGALTTSSINTEQAAKKPAIDPACVSLVSKIDSLRKDGITDRVAKAGAGKSKTVSVYRASLARMAELDRANAEYQARCGTLKPATSTARVTTPSATQTAASTATAAAKTAATDAAKKAATNAATKAAAKTVAKQATQTSAVKTVAKATTTEAVKKAATDAAVKKAVTN